MIKLLPFFLACSLCHATLPRPRGVSISMASLYKPGVPFRCRDNTKEIPFEYVNDDYCDCADGSDEPGTSACENGKFHCTNAGFKPTNILSSRVNDGICDCCDGTDEWNGNIECVNNCKELGKQMREEADKERQLQEQGYKLKLTYMTEGKKTRNEKKAELGEQEKLKVELEATKTDLEAKKTEAEQPEKEAKDKHEQAWKEELEKKQAEKEKYRAEIAFYELDENRDHKVTIEEVKAHTQFDVDSNGEVSDEEAREHLEGEEAVELAYFEEKVWPNIKQFYKSPDSLQDKTTEPPTTGEEPNKERMPNLDDDDDDDYLEEDEDDDEDDDDDDSHEEGSQNETEEKMPDYDEPTKQLISVADAARQQFTEADNKLRDCENNIRSLQQYLGNDYGPDEEYGVLKGNCFEFTDREYTYKLCGFDRATQRSKSGGAETTLGNWGKWIGSDNDKYSAQIYENGQNCWNGPNRSVKVYFKCGLEHKLTSASEPSRCEYAFDFETPSRCTEPSGTPADIHDEL